MKRRSLPGLGLLVTFLITTAALANEGLPVELWPIVQAPVGAQQSYRAVLGTQVEVVDRQGLFLLQEPRSLESSTLIAEHVTLTVLEPDPDGNVRLRVEAHPIHPQTNRPFLAPSWTGVYVLKPSERRAVLEEGTPPNNPLVSPEWLLWGHEMDEVSYDPMLPGEVREIVFSPDVLLGGSFLPLGTVDAEMPLESASIEFVGWESISEAQTEAALVQFTGELDVRATLDEVLRTSLSGTQTATVYMVPGDFPWVAIEQFEGTLRNEVVAGTATGFVDARVYTMLAFERTLPLTTDPTQDIQTGDVYGGVLPSDTWVLEDGTQATPFAFRGAEGEVVRITLGSSDFDPYLLLLDDAWNPLAEDDDSADGIGATVRVRLPYTGTYVIVVNTYRADEVGRYTLALESLGREVDADAMQALLEEGFRGIEEAAEGSDWDLLVDLLDELLDRTRLRLPLQIGELSLVTERALNYGEYVPRASRVYRPGESVHVYMEPQHFHTRHEAGRYEIHMTVDAALVDAQGNVVLSLPDVVVWNRITNRPVREVALSVPLWLGDVPSGNYVWRLTVRDMVSGQSATAEVPIVVATQTAWTGSSL